MRRVILAALLCGTALVAPNKALAGPIVSFAQFAFGGATAAGFGAITSIGGISVGATGGLLLGAGLRLAGSLALSSIAARLNRPRPPAQADVMRNYAQELPPMERAYGRVRKGGPMGFTVMRTNVQRITGGTLAAPVLTAESRATRYKTIILAAHSIDGVEQWFLDDQPIVLTDLGEIATEPMTGYGAIRLYTGHDGQTVDPVLNAVVPEITSAFDYAGLAYAVLEARRAAGDAFTKVYPQGRERELAPVIRADDRVYDPRDGALKYTNNAALVIAKEAIFSGRAVDWAEVAEEADVCDQIVANGDGGSQARWTINVTLNDLMPWEQVRDTLGMACGAWFYQRPDGLTGFKVGRWIEPEITLTDRDFLSLRIGEQEHGPDVAGEFTVTYIEPSRKWREAPSGALVFEAGRPRHNEPCHAIDSHNQAARVAKLVSRAMRPQFTVSGVLKLIGYECIGQRFVRINHTGLGRELVIEVSKLERSADGLSFLIEGRSATEADYEFDAAQEEPERPVNLPVVSDDTVAPVVGLTGEVVEGTGGVAQIEWSWTAPADTSLRQVLRLRSIAAGMADWMEISIAAGSTSFVATGLVDGASYEAQIQNRTGGGRQSEWSATVTVSAVANTDPPGALTAFDVTATGGGGEVTFTAPNDPLYYAARIWRGPTTTFASATVVRTEYGAAGLADSWTDAGLAAGSYSYWAAPINASGIAGPLSGPVTITIT